MYYIKSVFEFSSYSESDYKKWKKENVTLRGISDVDSGLNNGGSMLGSGLYTTFLSNKDIAKKYGKVHYVVNAIPKKPMVFKSLNEWEVWFYNEMVYKYSKAAGNDYPDIRDFNKVTSIENEMQKLGYDGIIIKGREMVNFKPSNVICFKNEEQLKNYYSTCIIKNL